MTIAGRNRILIFGICIAALMAVGSISCCIVIVAHNLLAELPTAPESAFRLLRLPFFAYSNYAVMAGVVTFPLIALTLLICVFFLFEKTHALEISFFSLFIFALSVEALQLLFPLQVRYPILTVFMPSIARIIFFFRFGACLALLTSSLFAHKTFTRETASIIFLLSFSAFALSHVIPIDTIHTVSFFSFFHSYRYLLYSFSGIVCVVFAGRYLPQYYRVPKGCDSAVGDAHCIYAFAVYRLMGFYRTRHRSAAGSWLLFSKSYPSIISMAIVRLVLKICFHPRIRAQQGNSLNGIYARRYSARAPIAAGIKRLS